VAVAEVETQTDTWSICVFRTTVGQANISTNAEFYVGISEITAPLVTGCVG